MAMGNNHEQEVARIHERAERVLGLIRKAKEDNNRAIRYLKILIVLIALQIAYLLAFLIEDHRNSKKVWSNGQNEHNKEARPWTKTRVT